MGQRLWDMFCFAFLFFVFWLLIDVGEPHYGQCHFWTDGLGLCHRRQASRENSFSYYLQTSSVMNDTWECKSEIILSSSSCFWSRCFNRPTEKQTTTVTKQLFLNPCISISKLASVHTEIDCADIFHPSLPPCLPPSLYSLMSFVFKALIFSFPFYTFFHDYSSFIMHHGWWEALFSFSLYLLSSPCPFPGTLSYSSNLLIWWQLQLYLHPTLLLWVQACVCRYRLNIVSWINP